MTDEEKGPGGPVGHTPHDGNPQMTVSVDFVDASPHGTAAREVARVSMQDNSHPGIRATLQYLVPDEVRRIEPVGFSVMHLAADRPEGAPPFGPGTIKDLPLARWDRVAQAAVIQAVMNRRLAEAPMVVLEAGESRRLTGEHYEGPGNSDDEIATPLHVPRDRRERAIEMVRRVRPDLDPDESRGAARSWNGLVKLAEAMDEYTALLAEGSTDVVGEMAAAHGVAPPTVRTWVHRARQAGLTAIWLGPDPATSIVPKYYRAATTDPSKSTEGADSPDPNDVALFDAATAITPPSKSLYTPERLSPREAAFRELGRQFLFARERSGIRLVDARKVIKIDPVIINQIDRGDFDSFEDDAKIRGYLRTYALALDLKPAAVLKQYAAAKALPGGTD
ncbi:helix-turn-helix domain-containing protein [Streptomyces sp. NE06-02F]|uniref:helix-turn-helix domain-containing protein n=1 Tax=Streptomyces caniscabiei TaxID=2746961 RepID=UPI0018725965|nr:helix-turn-helix transcriptional regulator [Streptomyces caniscabiei]MBE4790714.1 helix-turn-helix domain-containing protein [Streptomyces caniscabiei]MDX2947899.1 helix-turn-helix domain-containing protein [Streptomyces caniscabiei]